jgi:Protein of unknown function (DUF2971)
MDPLSDLPEFPPPAYLYHYTSTDGLYGIIKTGKIWATSIQYLNDAAEFKIAFDIFGELLRGQLELDLSSWFSSAWVSAGFCHPLESMAKSPIYVCSLTAKDDLLSQWRGYCPPDGGYCIGFETDALEECLRQQGYSLFRCEYDESTHRRILGPFVEEAKSWLLTGKEKAPTTAQDTWQKEFAEKFSRVAPLIKHGSFSEEQEWRAISSLGGVHRSQLNFRPGRTLLIPYVEIKLDCVPVKLDVVVGPNPNADLARDSLLDFLTSKQIPIREVRLSSIPFRKL